jgi:hypothetical protein
MAVIKGKAMMVEITRITKGPNPSTSTYRSRTNCGDFKVAHELYDPRANVVQNNTRRHGERMFL